MELNGLHHFALNVKNIERAEAFYTDILGFKISRRYPGEPRHIELDAGNVSIALFETPELDQEASLQILSSNGYLHYAFQTSRERFPEIISELKSRGVTIDNGPVVLGKGKSIYFKDPDGNRLEIRCWAENN